MDLLNGTPPSRPISPAIFSASSTKVRVFPLSDGSTSVKPSKSAPTELLFIIPPSDTLFIIPTTESLRPNCAIDSDRLFPLVLNAPPGPLGEVRLLAECELIKVLFLGSLCGEMSRLSLSSRVAEFSKESGPPLMLLLFSLLLNKPMLTDILRANRGIMDKALT